MPTITVWGQDPKSLWTPSGPVSVPDNYDFLPSGDAALTRAVKKAGAAVPLYEVFKRVSKRYPPRRRGIWAPASLIAAERERLAALRTEAHKAKLQRERERRQERDIREFAESIRLRFPACPADEALAIAQHACEVGSGRVGRSSTAADPVRAAVVAHIRHEHTDYDEMLWAYTDEWMDSEERQETRLRVREKVREEIDSILRRWEGSSEIRHTHAQTHPPANGTTCAAKRTWV